ncbi:MAG: cytochrome c oxidase subunit 3 family protein [Candidatus Aminicenantes bacterium]|nr:cytochrome c oxidase subunit 3 family protein [Candidatus Aminicenantes bacterium]NIM78448.1 cytochrome c oxidase subunit 3 family protein [Candidatus Aminicenantes bacterium]NIN17711.1 cytochrome c oxidase subunit 3 family protein [Candidatus Aminicenantes bacterium]NIN41587.1 cytochrome c oxidase subunit 3 family protein [Candidatus Aminicenantes bacterium]NIN84361.1 cytochrome c oxidase subunit 3 family protein [Candidatus Aminicenantes bacterium]
MTTTTATESLSHVHRDHTGARIGMWLFLFTEILLFGGLFLLYAVYRSKFSGDFHFCAGDLDTFLGAVNTAILLTSSLTMVLAVAGLEKKNRKLASLFLGLTIFLGFVFLVNKFFEWSAKIGHGIFPDSVVLQSHPVGENIFYSLYYLMTGLHGLHVVIGMVILSVMIVFISRTRKTNTGPGEELDRQSIQLENSGLYWHLVDIIWIFLFPLFYLVT